MDNPVQYVVRKNQHSLLLPLIAFKVVVALDHTFLPLIAFKVVVALDHAVLIANRTLLKISPDVFSAWNSYLQSFQNP